MKMFGVHLTIWSVSCFAYYVPTLILRSKWYLIWNVINQFLM